MSDFTEAELKLLESGLFALRASVEGISGAGNDVLLGDVVLLAQSTQKQIAALTRKVRMMIQESST